MSEALGQSVDKWAEWLRHRRFGGDDDIRERLLAELVSRREEVLDLAQLAAGETLLDVGCGEGLVGFGALERGAGLVIFSDISTDLLELCEQAATELGLLDRCRFVEARADDLSELAAASVDVVTTRSVLIYVADKRTALNEFARVLRGGGRISLFEPVNRFAQTGRETWMGLDLEPVRDVAAKVRAVYESIQPPESDPMLDFDERDLFRLAEEAGFFPVKLYLEAEVKSPEPVSWATFLNISGNPNIPTFAEAMAQVLTPAERARLTEYLQPLVEAGRAERRMAVVHLVGVKSGDRHRPGE